MCPLRSQLAPLGEAQSQTSRLSRTPSDEPSAGSEPQDPASAQALQKAAFDLSDNSVGSHGANNLPGNQSQLLSNGNREAEETEPRVPGCGSLGSSEFQLNGGGDAGAGSCDGKEAGSGAQPRGPGGLEGQEESPLIPKTLYLHRVRRLVLALLVEPHFLKDSTSMEEVVSSGSASAPSDPPSVVPVPLGVPTGPAHFSTWPACCCFRLDEHFLFQLKRTSCLLSVPQQPGVAQRSGSPPQDRESWGPRASGPPWTLQLCPL